MNSQSHAGMSSALLTTIEPDRTASEAIRTAMQTLAQRRVLREVLDELDARAAPVLILKGHALSQWLYPAAEQRPTADVDVLLANQPSVNGLMAWLTARGFAAVDATSAGDMVCFETTCCGPERQGKRVELDLHWRLSTMPLFAFKFEFAELMDASIALPALHPRARSLGPVHALLHACMHRAQNMPGGNHDEPRWLRDIELLIGYFTSAQWQQFLALAVERKLAAVCLEAIEAAGTTATPNSSAPKPVIQALRSAAAGQGMNMAHMHRWTYVQWQCWRAIPAMRQRLRWLRQRLWPTLQYLRHRHGAVARSQFALRGARIVAGVRRAAGSVHEPAD